MLAQQGEKPATVTAAPQGARRATTPLASGSSWLARAGARSRQQLPAWAAGRFSWRFLLGVLLCVLAAMLWRATQSYPTQLFDFYPLYYGAKAWLHGGNAYVLDAVAPARDHGYSLFEVGNTYPLPAVLLVLPLSLLPAKLAAIVWLGALTAGLLLALRLAGLPSWLLLTLPVLDGLRLEQYTILVLALQLVALWAYRTGRHWWLAWCCALILTKPNQGLVFVLAMLLLARHWRQQLVAGTLLWGGTLLLDPNWLSEWWPSLARYQALTDQPVFWWLALFAIPLLLVRDYIGGAIVLQFVLLPFPILSTYAASAVPLSVLDDRRSKWLVPLSFLWVVPALLIGQAWATALTLILPVVVLAALRRREQTAACPRDGQQTALPPVAVAREPIDGTTRQHRSWSKPRRITGEGKRDAAG